MSTQIERLAAWIVELRLEDVPEEVRRLAVLQMLDTFAGICAGARSPAGRRVRAALSRLTPRGPCRVLPDGASWGMLEAVYLHSSLANALELDNFVLSGHLGQSAVTTALAVGAMANADGRDTLLAQIAGVEAATRLGAYLTTGPQQGHMRAYVHRVAAAATTSRLLGLDVRKTAQALAIALSTPEFPLYPGAFSADTKVVLTSGPSVAGIQSALMAEAGLDAPLDIVEHPLGVLTYFSYLKHIPDVWGGLGRTWFLYSLSSKSQATCAYAQGPVTAALRLRDRVLDLSEIESVTVHAPMTTLVMEAFSRPHLGAGLTPVNTHFSTRRSVAAALLHGPLDGAYYADEGSFSTRAASVAALTERVSLRHDWGMTVDFLRGVDAGLDGGGKPGILGMSQTRASLDRFREAFGSRPLMRWSDLPELLRIPRTDLAFLARRYWRGYRACLPFVGGAAARAAYRSVEHDFRRIRLALAGRVAVRLRDGSLVVSECRIPPGFAGDPGRERTIIDKFNREASPVLGPARAQALAARVLALPSGTARDLMNALDSAAPTAQDDGAEPVASISQSSGGTRIHSDAAIEGTEATRHSTARTMSITTRMLLLAGAMAVTAGCEHGEVPENPGRVEIVVIDDRAAPVPNVEGRAETVNRSGGVFSIGGRTGADGRVLISGISAGRRFVEVVPPAEYVATGSDNRREVDVVEGATVTVTFRLLRRASGP